MSNKGNAYALATAIYAGTQDQPIVDIDDLGPRAGDPMLGQQMQRLFLAQQQIAPAPCCRIVGIDASELDDQIL